MKKINFVVARLFKIFMGGFKSFKTLTENFLKISKIYFSFGEHRFRTSHDGSLYVLNEQNQLIIYIYDMFSLFSSIICDMCLPDPRREDLKTFYPCQHIPLPFQTTSSGDVTAGYGNV